MFLGLFTIFLPILFIGWTVYLFMGDNAEDWSEPGETWYTEVGLDWIMFLKDSDEVENIPYWAVALSFLLYIICTIVVCAILSALLAITAPVSIPFIIITYLVYRAKTKQNNKNQ